MITLDLDAIRQHVAIVHRLAAPLAGQGKLLCAAFGEDPDTPDPKTGKPGCPLIPKIRHFAIGDVDGMVAAIADLAMEQHRNVYMPLAVFRQDLRLGHKGFEKDIVGVLGLVADFDDAEAEQWPQRLPIPPSYVLETSIGRFQAFYFFGAPAPFDAMKPLAARLQAYARCDHGTQDLSHVWRIPRTPNWPNARKLAAGRPREPQQVDVVHDFTRRALTFAELAAALPERDDKITLLVRSLPTKWRQRIAGPIAGDRSANAFAVIAELIRRGHDDRTIEAIIRAHPQGIGERYVNRGDLGAEIARIRAKTGDKGRQTAPNQPIPAGDWYQHCITGTRGNVLSNLANALLALRQDKAWIGGLAFDEMANRPMLLRPVPGEKGIGADPPSPRPIVDHDVDHAQEWLQLAGLPALSKDIAHQAVIAVACETRFHPVRQYLEGLQWDGVDRLDDWLSDCLGVEKTEYAMAIGRMFLIAMVARIFDPGCQADYMLILEGPQGDQKSSACRILAGEWFSDDLPSNVGSKDAHIHLCGPWLIEVAELHSFGRSEIDMLKAFITRRIDIYRPPYGRQEVHQPRQSMFVGTVNVSVYFVDPTGNRRFWPVLTSTIDLLLLASLRDQLFAEAVVRYRRGEKWWPDRDFEDTHIRPEQEQRYHEDAWEEPIANFVSGLSRTTVYAIARDALFLDTGRISPLDQNRIIQILQHFGWRRGQRTRTTGKRSFQWLAP